MFHLKESLEVKRCLCLGWVWENVYMVIIKIVSWAPILSLIPLTNMLTGYRAAMWTTLLLGMGAKSAIGTGSMAAINILVNKNCMGC